MKYRFYFQKNLTKIKKQCERELNFRKTWVPKTFPKKKISKILLVFMEVFLWRSHVKKTNAVRIQGHFILLASFLIRLFRIFKTVNIRWVHFCTILYLRTLIHSGSIIYFGANRKVWCWLKVLKVRNKWKLAFMSIPRAKKIINQGWCEAKTFRNHENILKTFFYLFLECFFTPISKRRVKKLLLPKLVQKTVFFFIYV